MTPMRRGALLLFGVLLACAQHGYADDGSPPAAATAKDAHPAFRAAAYAVDITPEQFPVAVNGGFLAAAADRAVDRLHARWLVLDDGTTRLAICVVDSCVLPRELVDEAKGQIQTAAGLLPGNVVIAATHTHSAPSVMALLGAPADAHYPALLVKRLVEGATRAVSALTPARIGWASVQDFEHTHCRQWVYRPDRMLTDPFGGQTVRANMHPGYQNTSTIGPTGPVDPQLSVVSVQTPDGRPVAVLANYSMHYFGVPAVSSDYFGPFCRKLADLVAPSSSGGERPFVGIMSQGTSGDLHWMDYAKPEKNPGVEAYAAALAARAHEAYRNVTYHDWVSLAASGTELTLDVRVPDATRLAWARGVAEGIKGREPRTVPEVYALEQITLHENPTRRVNLQVLRVGDLGITAIPCEVFGLTGLKLKAQSPLPATFNMELANGEFGYIPPPELHKLGGYTTWPARSACLEAGAEPKIVEALLSLLETVSGKPRRTPGETHGLYARAVLDAKPLAYWRLNEFTGLRAADASGNGRPGSFEDGVLFHLDGPNSAAFSGEKVINRSPHFAGGRMTADLPGLGGTYSVEMWVWNGLPGAARPVAGYLFSRGRPRKEGAPGDHLGIGGTFAGEDRLLFFNGDALNQVLVGATRIEPKTWNHVVLVRDGTRVRAYLNGNARPEIDAEAAVGVPASTGNLFVGGRNDNFANFEGKIDEVAVYGRALSGEEVAAHFKAAALAAPAGKASSITPEPPRSPQESLAAMHVREGFEVELVAAEPLVRDPVALAWGPDGKLWVAEMADYPYGEDGKMKPGGRIRFLEDTDGDGKYDKSTVLIEGANFPTGVLPWRKGVIVTAAPEIFYAEDTDGDGKADVRQVLYSGFTEGNPQLRVNGLRWGLDNWIYCANGWSSAGKIKSEKTGATIDVGGRDLRIRPDDGAIDAETGMTEFGRDRDDWGEWFGCNNSQPMWHFVLSDRYTRRNPHVAPPEPRVQMMVPNNPRVFPLSRPEKRYHSFEQAGHFTSACSVMVYRDELLFPHDPARAHAFVCEPVHNLVHHEVTSRDGVSFTAARPREERASEFLASEDSWFRPAMVTTGPDGALWVADMYRAMIEHPDWLPEEGKRDWQPFYRQGEDRGRIYRVYPKGKRPRAIPRLGRLPTPDLVAALDSPNGWQRDLAQMMLLWRNDPAAVAPLEHLASASKSPLARLHALCTLDGLNALKPQFVERALRDEDPGLRRNAVRLAEARAKDAPQLVAAAVKLADDPDPSVRLQLACTLGEWDDPQAGAALGRLALRDGGDAYVSAAVMSSAVKHYAVIADALLTPGQPPGGPLLQNLLNVAVVLGNREVAARLVAPLLAPAQDGQYSPTQMRAFARWLETLGLRGTSIQQLIAGGNDDLSAQLNRAAAMFEMSRKVAGDSARPAEERAAAASLLGWEDANLSADLKSLASLLAPQTPAEVQRAAVRALSRRADQPVPALLIPGWSGYSPEVRVSVAELLLGQEPWAFELLKAVEAKQVAAVDLDAARRQRLLESSSARVKALAQTLLAGEAGTSRQKVVDARRSVLDMTGDAKRGKVVFAQNCAVCHRAGDVGAELGPDLRSVGGWSPDAILTAVLDPNRAVEPRFIAYDAKLADGASVFGVVTAETGNSITMKGLDGKERPILRGEIRSLASTGRSLMPDGLEAAIDKQGLADLIAFVKDPAAAR